MEVSLLPHTTQSYLLTVFDSSAWPTSVPSCLRDPCPRSSSPRRVHLHLGQWWCSRGHRFLSITLKPQGFLQRTWGCPGSRWGIWNNVWASGTSRCLLHDTDWAYKRICASTPDCRPGLRQTNFLLNCGSEGKHHLVHCALMLYALAQLKKVLRQHVCPQSLCINFCRVYVLDLQQLYGNCVVYIQVF